MRAKAIIPLQAAVRAVVLLCVFCGGVEPVWAGGDTEAPVVAVTLPNGGEMWTGGSQQPLLYSATDNVGVTNISIYYRDAETVDWIPLDLQEPNVGVFTFYTPNTPTTEARVRVVARDAAGNIGADESNAVFTITPTPGGFLDTTLRDFHLPGTQALTGISFQSVAFCELCHGGYDQDVEPGFNFKGSMMAHSARDPVFFAALAISEQDAPSSGDYCLRCHSPVGWLNGRCNPTDGTLLEPADKEGVTCDFCHRSVDPIYEDGVSPPEDVLILEALAPEDVPNTYSDGQYVIDPNFTWRGPFSDPEAQHPFIVSPVHRESAFCGTCHDVSNPAMHRVGLADYAPGPLDEKADSTGVDFLMPAERTFSEWLYSDFSTLPGVFAPEFAGNKADGMVSTCQDCHMRDVEGRGCNAKTAPLRPDLPLHDFSGANTWVLGLLHDLYPTVTDEAALDAGVERARYMLQNAADLEVSVGAEADSFRAEVTVTNRSGHKLPTGFPEGRRMWLHVQALDQSGEVIYESGAYDFDTGVLTHDPDLKTYEVEFGISHDMAAATGLPAGPSFRNAVNDTVYSDNRIPPLGFSNAAYQSIGAKPFHPDGGPGDLYPDGQNWDVTEYALPVDAWEIEATLYFQIVTKEYVEFLRDANTTNTAGQELYDLWVANGRAAPEVMATLSSYVSPSDVPDAPVSSAMEPMVGPNPFAERVTIVLAMPSAADLRMDVFDLQGRRVASVDRGRVPAGPQQIHWDGRTQSGRDAGSGIFWVRVEAGAESFVRRIVRLK